MRRPSQNKTNYRKAYKYFFLNDKPHRLLKITWHRDEVLAWSYFDEERVMYPWSQVRRHGQRGFTVSQVAEIMMREKMQINRWIYGGKIDPPVLVTNPGSDWKVRLFSEDDLFKIRDYAASVHRGRPRKDGLVTNNRVPSKEDIYLKLKYDGELYIKTEDGRFIRFYEVDDSW